MHQITWVSTQQHWSSFEGQWERLAEHSPCRQWSWLKSWWSSFGAGRQLMVGAMTDEGGQLLAALPCYWERTQHEGRVLRLIGSGTVCSDFIGLLARPGSETLASERFAEALLQRNLTCSEGHQLRWDQLDWDGVAANDTTTLDLLLRLETAGCRRREAGQFHTWRLPIAASFDEQIESCGKSMRRKLRNIHRRWWEPGKAILRTCESDQDLERGLEILIDLHQKRRTSIGESGCFAEDSFQEFFSTAARELFAQDIWEINWTEVDGEPIAVQTGFWLAGVFYMYQSGYDPQRESLEPGWLMNVGIIDRAIQEGWRAIDFMRGDERYKGALRAVPTWCHRQRVCHASWDSRTRFAAYGLANDLKRWWSDRQSTETQDAATSQ